VPGFSPALYAHDDRHAGQGWRQVPTAKGVPVRMNAVAAVSDRAGWMVGDQGTDAQGRAVGGVFTEHWDGHGWKAQQLPLPGGTAGAGLLSVAGVATNDAWAVGWRQVMDAPVGGRASSHGEGLLAHWNGRAWQRVDVPAVRSALQLSSVTAVNADDVWAVGSRLSGSTLVPLTLHYDGHTWTPVTTTDRSVASGSLLAIASHGRDDVWAAGVYQTAGSRVNHSLLEHWNGRRWTRVDATPRGGALTGIAAVGSGAVAVGTSDSGSAYGVEVAGGSARDLGLPAGSPTTRYAPWTVAVYGRQAVVSGARSQAGQNLPQPLLLTGRI
jgi:hypothetical protein